MTELPLRLRALNLIRWCREHAISWGLLSVIYSYTVAMILQPILEKTFSTSIPLGGVWLAAIALLLLPAAIEFLPFGSAPVLSSQRYAGAFSWGRSFGGPLFTLYLSHEWRRAPTWIAILATAAVAGLLPYDRRALWILIAQFPLQRALYSLSGWRGLALLASPRSGASQLLRCFLASQLTQFSIAWLAIGAAGFFSLGDWIRLGVGGLGMTFAASAVALEGDAGKPWMVNFLALAAGALGGFLSYATPWALLACAYLFHMMQSSVGSRLHSVEHQDEDRLLS